METTKYLSLREIQLEELEILKKIIKFIEEKDLKYSLISGTLLGAIRHKGFIPWDDDIDIGMPRPDYEKFLELFDKENPFPNIRLCHAENKTGFLPFCKAVNIDIAYSDDSICDQENRYLWIDIVPIDGLPESEKKLKKMCKLEQLYAKALYIHYYKINFKYDKNIVKNIKKIILKPFALCISANTITKMRKKTKYSQAKYVGNFVAGYGVKERLLKEDYDHYIDIEFEKVKMRCIKNYDKYLSNIYGEDYMSPPPLEKRRGHHIQAWRIHDDKEAQK